MDILGLLRSKNRCLSRFLEASFDFIKEAEKGDFSPLDRFQEARASALKALELYDRKLNEVASTPPSSSASGHVDLTGAIEPLLAEKDRLLQQILAADEKVIALIEREKERVKGQIASSRKSQEMMKKFKSTWVSGSGEEIDEKL